MKNQKMKYAIKLTIIAILGLLYGYAKPEKPNCTAQNGRALEICKAISDNLEWQWFGHAIIAPDWKPGFKTAHNAYCALNLTSNDISTLKELSSSARDWRLQTGADDLIRLLNPENEPENSIFSSQNPDYILKDRCNI